MTEKSARLRLATGWLDGCSGCHMSMLDMDERILELAEKIEWVYSPLVDCKEVPKDIDLAILEGAVSSSDDLEKLRKVRANSKFLIAIGDCAVTANIPSMRNVFSVDSVMDRAYKETVACQAQHPSDRVPRLLEKAQPIHHYVAVDLYLPGCPPPADAIYHVLTELLNGRIPNPSAVSRFGK